MRRSPLYEVLGQLGMWGMIVTGVQASILEHKKMRESTWNSTNRLLPPFLFRRLELTLGALSGTPVSLHNWYVVQ